MHKHIYCKNKNITKSKSTLASCSCVVKHKPKQYSPWVSHRDKRGNLPFPWAATVAVVIMAWLTGADTTSLSKVIVCQLVKLSNPVLKKGLLTFPYTVTMITIDHMWLVAWKGNNQVPVIDWPL